MFFWKRKPVEPFKPFIRIKMNGLGHITMRYWPHPDMGIYIPVPNRIINRAEAEEYAEKFLEDKEKENLIIWKTDVSI